jgi:multicomponent Na+:H+ antiporter subunit C
VLVATGLYMMMRRSSIKLLIGIALLSHAANLLVFTAGGTVRDGAPLIDKGETQLLTPYADPLPQALILTALVISFGVMAFAIALVLRTYSETATDDLNELTTTEQ